MKNLIKDESAVAYLLLVGLFLTLIVVGIAYMFISDFVDFILNGINGFAGTPLAGQLDQSSIDTGNLLLVLFKFCLIYFLFIIIYWVWTMAQKPERPY
jgi:hypothetical protein